MTKSKNKRVRRKIKVGDFSKCSRQAATRWLKHFRWRFYAGYSYNAGMVATYKSALLLVGK